ncbi:MAG: YhbY family RNA-binding protein [Sphaerochaetaceae bacterium]|nr:YhbY family RNA-binding protein [Sphaerochaetaceae bacterium]MDD3163068.1 YhbY family RNA-binding protein [Sphaerochaetaceae bacterium]MDD4006587.1 YhbY family RNA-binding protein [Sphaerochaetaceae bacterium]MDD4396516.1 YhbY family RNA-binding protein [Sphaerochaetaceae bacterium]
MDSRTRSFLRSKAQTVSPVVMVGKAGQTDAVVDALSDALDCHELVKVRFQCLKDQVRPVSESLAEETGSDLVATTGFTAVFFKQNIDPSKRIIRLPD